MYNMQKQVKDGEEGEVKREREGGRERGRREREG